jgi:hypothetical protein
MKNLLIVTAATLLTFAASAADKKEKTTRQPSSDAHKACVMSALDAIYNSQVKDLKLNATDRAKFTVEWYGDMINNDPEYKKMEDDLKIICTKAYIMAVPLAEK